MLYKCGGCNATYYSKTKHHFKAQICEHIGISHFTGNKVKIKNSKLRASQEHILCCNYCPWFFEEDFSILTGESSDFKLKIMESLLIACDKSVFNKVDSSLPLVLFWYNINGNHVMFYTSYDAHCAYTIVVCSVFSIMLRVLVFYQKQHVWAFNIILRVTMKVVAFWKLAVNK